MQIKLCIQQVSQFDYIL